MEENRGGAGFFFAHGVEKLSTLLEVSKHRYGELFGGNTGSGYDAPERHFTGVIQKRIDDRQKELMWLAANDPVKVDALERMPLFEYWALLNTKVGETNRELARAKIRK